MEYEIFEKLCICLTVLMLTCIDLSQTICYRKPQGATGDRSAVDENFQIQIDGNPASYMPGQQYNISLSCANGLKFISFTLLLEADTTNMAADEQSLGHFEIIDNAETRFSALCEHMVESSNANGKSRIDVAWVAPTDPQSGCILFKAAILQHRDVWFIDDGFLTRRLCPEEIDEMNSQTPPVNPCCACDEAKYEIIVQRKWRRNTHAKDFPSETWRTKLGDVIGASHSLDFRFWEYGGHASQGLQELAEHGATKTLENEIMQHVLDGSIRTIIKAPVIKYRPNVIGKTLATARVGPNHHVISLVLKIDPSPDWILGVSGLELCLANCTWIKEKVLNLYPWDIGTDAGPSYMSPDQAQHPPDVIRRITSTYPSDYRSPFFNQVGAPMKPLATLHVTRKRTYERECDFEESAALECSTHPWSSWSECSVKCGPGTQYRLRSYKDPRVAENFNCNVILRQNQTCMGSQCGVQRTELPSAECELTSWTLWSDCSKKCGKGLQTRTRDYTNPYAKEKCQAGINIELQQTRPCNGENCGGNILTPSYDITNHDNFDQNFEEQERERNLFKQPNLNWDQHGKKRKPIEMEEEKSNSAGSERNIDDANYDEMLFRFGNISSFRSNENEDFENARNIYGNEKLLGGKIRRPYEQGQSGNINVFGDLEDNLDNTRQTTNSRNFENFKEKDAFKTRAGVDNFPNSYNNMRNPYRYKNIYPQEVDQEKYNFCWEKPVATSRHCNKKRPIVKNYWFYDADDSECKLFTADDCDENTNKFLSMEKCLEKCSQNAIKDKKDINRSQYNSGGFRIKQKQPFYTRWN